MLIDLHSHTVLSDGTLRLENMVAAAERRGYAAYAVTDHATGGDPAYLDVVREVRAQVDRLRPQTPIRLFAGVELTDFEPEQITKAAAEVRRHGAEVIVVHGETLDLVVRPGTNAAAARCPDVDVLAHPGLLSLEDASAAARHGVAVELSARHSWANGHTYRVARKARATLVVDSDAHDEAGLLSVPKVEAVVRGAGASPAVYRAIVEDMTRVVVAAIEKRLAAAPRELRA